MRILKFRLAALLALGAFALAACETPEERSAREAQFVGQPLKSVIARIGQPNTKTAEKAIWHYKETNTHFTPIYAYNQFGQARVVGQTSQVITVTCTFTARLKSGRVTDAQYEGNGCVRYAPGLPK